MLPSARAGQPSIRAPPRGRTGHIGEGRQSGSRSNSVDSVTSERTTTLRRRSIADSSDDEESSSGGLNTGSSSFIRPASGFQWGQTDRQSGFGFVGSSAFSLFQSRQSNASNASSTQPVSPASGGAFSASASILPSKVFKGNTSDLPANDNSSPAVSTEALTVDHDDSSAKSARSFAKQSITVPSADALFRSSGQRSEQEGSVVNAAATGAPSTIAQESELAARQTNTDPRNPSNGQPEISHTTVEEGIPASGCTSNQDLQSSQNLIIQSSSSNSERPTVDVPSSVPAAQTTEITSTLPSPLQTSESNPNSNSKAASRQRANVPKQRKRKLKKDSERKRGSFRVEMYQPSSAPGSEPERAFSTLPGKPLFSIADSISPHTTPLPYFEYKERGKRIQPTQSIQTDAASTRGTITPASAVHDLSDCQFSEGVHNGLTGDPSGDTDTGVSICDYDQPQVDTSEYPDACSSLALLPESSSRSLQLIGEMSSGNQTTTTTTTQKRQETISYTSSDLLDAHTAAAPIENRSVSVVIEDKRLGQEETSFVELMLPLRSDGRDGFWLDAVPLCNALQSGPSRIDGPAKVCAFRGRFKQYFLRISAENVDNFAPANLYVPGNRFLRIIVEPIIPHSPHLTDATSSYATLPRSASASTQLASLALSEERLLPASNTPATSPITVPIPTPAPAPVPMSTTRPSQIKKRKSDEPPEANSAHSRNAATSRGSTSGAIATRNEAEAEDPMAPRKSYYRMR